MADDSVIKFSVTWLLFGVLFVSLLGFATTFMFNNNPTGLGDAGDVFETTQTGLSSKLFEVPAESNAFLNITAKTNPEVSFLGSRDSVATAYGTVGIGQGFFESAKTFMDWIFTSDEKNNAGEMLIAVFGGLFAIVSLYWIIKLIRTGS